VVTIEIAPVPVGTSEPDGVKDPFAPIAKTETLLEEKFATYAKCPAGSVVIDDGPAPVATGDPATSRNAPDAGSIWNMETLSESRFAM
jgi:hypothetical protein